MGNTLEMNLIIGAGNFSHAHIRVLSELNINRVEIFKNTPWNEAQKQKFLDLHPSTDFEFAEHLTPIGKVIHVVTPSNTHLDLLQSLQEARTIFVEKPSVLYERSSDFEIANAIFRGKKTIYQNDWFAGLNALREKKSPPQKVKFVYNVKESRNIDLLEEVVSHLVNILSLWCEADANISIQNLIQEPHLLEFNANIDHKINVEVRVTSNIVEKSNWALSVFDDSTEELFSSENIGGELLQRTFETMLFQRPALTDWYKCSWLLHHFRCLFLDINYFHHFDRFFRGYVGERRIQNAKTD